MWQCMKWWTSDVFLGFVFFLWSINKSLTLGVHEWECHSGLCIHVCISVTTLASIMFQANQWCFWRLESFHRLKILPTVSSNFHQDGKNAIADIRVGTKKWRPIQTWQVCTPELTLTPSSNFINQPSSLSTKSETYYSKDSDTPASTAAIKNPVSFFHCSIFSHTSSVIQ